MVQSKESVVKNPALFFVKSERIVGSKATAPCPGAIRAGSGDCNTILFVNNG